jgi:hypothetical protein
VSPRSERRLCRARRPIDAQDCASLWAFCRGRRYVAPFCTKILLKDGPIRRQGLRENPVVLYAHPARRDAPEAAQ